ncbi:MAG: PQQ-dependent sugar dehydrogenase [Verrucomicrobiota bacterium]
MLAAAAPVLFSGGLSPAAAAVTEADMAAQVERGGKVFSQICWTCHQTGGQGLAGIFPPLAGSDYLMGSNERVIRDLILGLSGEVTVNGVKYNNVMPPSGLDDGKIADVLTYARRSWGNQGPALTAGEVAKVRASLSLTKENVAAMQAGFLPLPAAPEGFTIQELAQTPEQVSRLASDGNPGRAFMLSTSGNMWRLDTETGAVQPVARAEEFLNSKGGVNCMGLAFDRKKRLYITGNRQDRSEQITMNRVTIFRTDGPLEEGVPAKPRPWLEVTYPWGIGPFNHGVGHLALGPDGMLYCGSGSRTDGNEPGNDGRLAKTGEHPLTACIWRLDPEKEKPEPEIFARGLRNPYGFCWTPSGEMFATDNGPDADAPEELDVIVRGAHYGFPYQFSDWTQKAYPYSPDAPAGLKMTRPLINAGPDGGFSGNANGNGAPMSTFDPHSCPAGFCYLDDTFPENCRGAFLIPRFGNMLPKPLDTGFDAVLVRPLPAPAAVSGAGQEAAENARRVSVKTFLTPLGRPVDALVSGPGTILIAEYSRSASNSGPGAMLPGRILRLRAVK